MDIVQITGAMVLAPLLGSIIVGLFRKQCGEKGAHTITILGVSIAFACAIYLAFLVLYQHAAPVYANIYTWANGEPWFSYNFQIGFLIDSLTVCMVLIVSFVSLLVHIYSIGYMHDDPGYARFFSYISLFTFMMLVLVTANNFMQLFFGWEGVGLVSYLLIGFWYQKESAISGGLKAFLVNRVGDFGFILGIGLIMSYFGSLDYSAVFHQAPGTSEKLMTLICLLLFVGAMGKSAQVPLHVWLPESMEGPTPISALIHAATMVTAGVFMLARISPLLMQTVTASSVILIVGATGALFMGLLGIVMNDIKRVVAYSTLSQLGYMVAAMGAGALNAGIFHLLTHACFKALLFLAAGSVIIGMHHEQDMRKMGGLWRKMPVTYITFLIGSLALCALPPFSGFYSKDTIIEAVKISTIYGSKYAYICLVIGAMVTALYTFRAFFMTFHGNFKQDLRHFSKVHESPWVVLIPLILLAIPSIIIGYILYMPMLFDKNVILQGATFVAPAMDVLAKLRTEIHSPLESALEAYLSPVFWMTLAGIFISFVVYVLNPKIPDIIARKVKIIYTILTNKYWFDAFNDLFFVKGIKMLGRGLYQIGDVLLIDNFFVNGTARVVAWFSLKGKLMQSGYLYQYLFFMIVSLVGILLWICFQ